MVQRRVRRRIDGDFEEREEDVVEHLLEVLHRALAAVDVVQPRELDEPDDVVAEDAVVQHPRREGIPLGGAAAVNGDSVLGHLVLGRLQVRDDFFRHLG